MQILFHAVITLTIQNFENDLREDTLKTIQKQFRGQMQEREK